MKIKGYDIENRHIIKSAVYLVLLLVSAQGYFHFDLYTKLRYGKQAMVALSIVFLFLLLRSIRHLIPERAKEAFFLGVAKLWKRAAEQLEKAATQVRKLLGLPEKAVRIDGEDEQTFIFRSEDGKKRKKAFGSGTRLKWKDMVTNADKVRFFFVRFVLKKKHKGFRYLTVKTPLENAREWKLTEDEKKIFSLYTDARFSGGRRLISDEEVELSERVAK